MENINLANLSLQDLQKMLVQKQNEMKNEKARFISSLLPESIPENKFGFTIEKMEQAIVDKLAEKEDMNNIDRVSYYLDKALSTFSLLTPEQRENSSFKKNENGILAIIRPVLKKASSYTEEEKSKLAEIRKRNAAKLKEMNATEAAKQGIKVKERKVKK
jgi:hypothetical protein